jgi:hypothetical protein
MEFKMLYSFLLKADVKRSSGSIREFSKFIFSKEEEVSEEFIKKAIFKGLDLDEYSYVGHDVKNIEFKASYEPMFGDIEFIDGSKLKISQLDAILVKVDNGEVDKSQLKYMIEKHLENEKEIVNFNLEVLKDKILFVDSKTSDILSLTLEDFEVLSCSEKFANEKTLSYVKDFKRKAVVKDLL